MRPSESDLVAFLRDASERAWPDNLAPASMVELAGFYQTIAQDGPFAFVDLFGGDRTDIGFEAVFWHGRLVWGATYHGGLTDPDADLQEAYGFLARALGARPPDALPLRGPRSYAELTGGFEYRHELNGGLASFVSLERIYHHGSCIYERLMSGGWAGDSEYGRLAELPSLPPGL